MPARFGAVSCRSRDKSTGQHFVAAPQTPRSRPSAECARTAQHKCYGASGKGAERGKQNRESDCDAGAGAQLVAVDRENEIALTIRDPDDAGGDQRRAKKNRQETD